MNEDGDKPLWYVNPRGERPLQVIGEPYAYIFVHVRSASA